MNEWLVAYGHRGFRVGIGVGVLLLVTFWNIFGQFLQPATTNIYNLHTARYWGLCLSLSGSDAPWAAVVSSYVLFFFFHVLIIAWHPL